MLSDMGAKKCQPQPNSKMSSKCAWTVIAQNIIVGSDGDVLMHSLLVVAYRKSIFGWNRNWIHLEKYMLFSDCTPFGRKPFDRICDFAEYGRLAEYFGECQIYSYVGPNFFQFSIYASYDRTPTVLSILYQLLCFIVMSSAKYSKTNKMSVRKDFYLKKKKLWKMDVQRWNIDDMLLVFVSIEQHHLRPPALSPVVHAKPTQLYQ